MLRPVAALAENAGPGLIAIANRNVEQLARPSEIGASDAGEALQSSAAGAVLGVGSHRDEERHRPWDEVAVWIEAGIRVEAAQDFLGFLDFSQHDAGAVPGAALSHRGRDAGEICPVPRVGDVAVLAGVVTDGRLGLADLAGLAVHALLGAPQ